jgi:hypothetical protein
VNKLLLFFFFLLSVIVFRVDECWSQEDRQLQTRYDSLIRYQDFDPRVIAELIFENLNKFRMENFIEVFKEEEILQKAAQDQANYMAYQEDVSTLNRGKRKTTAKRVKLHGGSHRVDEIVDKENAKRGQEMFTYREVAREISEKWKNKSKVSETLLNPKYMLAGIGAELDEEGKKIYFSMVLGNYQSINEGAHLRKTLKVPFTKKKYGLKAFDEKECKKCERFDNIEELQNHLYIHNSYIYFAYDDLKEINKLLRERKDGLAVDIIQTDQYPCDKSNIIDYNLPNKGYMLKRVYSGKLFRSNEAEPEEEGKKVKSLTVKLEKFPKEIAGDYEMNLLVIKNKHVCKSLTPTYIEYHDVDHDNDMNLMPDEETIKYVDPYIPIADSTLLEFIIPFEQGKFKYDNKDIRRFIEALNEPDFVIKYINIYAYSSIEGTERENEKLQNKRAESIVKALKNIQNKQIEFSIHTSDSWDQFVQDVIGTPYSYLANMSPDDANEEIKRKNLIDELEPILSQHRYARIEMMVQFNLETKKQEEAFVLNRFNNAVRDNEIQVSYSIQKYILRKVIMKEFSVKAIHKQKIPLHSSFVPHLTNKLWAQKYFTKKKLNKAMCQHANKIYKLDERNIISSYNNMCCRVFHLTAAQENIIDEIQKSIDAFYNSVIPEKRVDALNLEFQFKLLRLADSISNGSKYQEKAYKVIKEIANFEGTNWESALQLASLFIAFNDYKYALKILDPHIDNPAVSENYLYTYLSICSFNETKLLSKQFADVVSKAALMNSKRFCRLFDGTKMTIQALENPVVKEVYCKECE